MKFEEYLKLEWKKWKKFIELSKLENEGKEEKNAFVSVPFIFANKNNFVIINEIMRDVILSFFGNECNMLTIIKGKKLSLLEEIKDGYFVDYK